MPRVRPDLQLTPEQRRVHGQISANARWAAIPASERPAATQAARDARWRRYLDAVPERVTDPEERERLAAQARRADMLRMSLAASKARRANARRAAADRDDDGSAA